MENLDVESRILGNKRTVRVYLPPGYQRALMYGLAQEVASQFGIVQLPPGLMAAANEAKKNIQLLNASNNIPTEDVQMPAA